MAPPTKKSKTTAGQSSLKGFFASPAKQKTDESPTDDLPAVAEATPTKHIQPDISTTPRVQSSPQVQQKSGLSEEQRLKIEENRRKALEKQQAKKRGLDEKVAVNSSPGRSATIQAAQSGEPVKSSPALASPSKATVSQLPPVLPFSNNSGNQNQPTAGKGKSKAKAKSKAFGNPAATDIQLAIQSSSEVSNAHTPTTPAVSQKTSSPQQEKVAPKRESNSTNVPPGKFSQKSNDWKQYFGVYRQRIIALRRSALREAHSIWGGALVPDAFRAEISGFRRHVGELVIVGLLSKEHKNRSNVVHQFKNNPLSSRLLSEETLNGTNLGPGGLCSDEDSLWIEDSTMRLKLTVDPQLLHGLCSGIVGCVRGTASADGGFVVSSIVFVNLPPPAPLGPPAADPKVGPFIAFVSGFASPDDDAPSAAPALERLVEFVSRSESNVKQLIVCGGALCTKPGQEGMASKDALAVADELLCRLAAACTVRLMPGQADPTNYSLPQMPLHPDLFRKARNCGGSFRCVTNPYCGQVENTTFNILGHSGQPVFDILRCTRGTTPIGALRLCLEAMHLAPTAPDTLATPPFQDEDPFLIDEVPHVLFSGGHERAEHDWIRAPKGDEDRSGTQCICVPAFHRRPAAVLVNVNDPRDVRVQEFVS